MGRCQVTVWLLLNLLDLVLSIVSLNYGARELPMLAWLLEKEPKIPEYEALSFLWYGLYKMGLAVLVPAVLARIKKPHLFKWLNICLGCLCFYIIVMLVKTFS